MDCDVFIAGGGLAGLSLARQLRREAGHLRVVLAEKRRHPVPEAAFKVGESSVEIGAHYFQRILGLEGHLRQGHLEKLGLRYFFTNGDNKDLARRFEVGPVQISPGAVISARSRPTRKLAARRESCRRRRSA